MRSLRSGLILASALWTAGLLMLMHLASLMMIHTLPRFRSDHSILPTAIGIFMMALGLWGARAGLSPFRRLQAQVQAIRRGDIPRIQGSYPTEIRSLIDSLNELLEERESSIKRAHAAAGDLAHGLKTPLALLAREAEVARAAGNPELADAIAQQVKRMSNQVDYHLARARAAASSTETARCEVAPCVAALQRTLSKLYAERELQISASVAAGLCVRVQAEDLEEILGNVLDNACKWSHTTVNLVAAQENNVAVITVDDDGPGLAAHVRDVVLQRGVRLDEAAPGSGLGLSIVRDLTEHYGGTISLEESQPGGLRVRLTLPAA